jgi:hypothetical protein
VTGQSHRGAVTAKNWIVLIAIMVVASAIGIASMLSLRWFPEQG